jgi:dTDP-4-dehydrorhamnose reductase
VIPDLVRIPLDVYEDERGWFCELRRDSSLPQRMMQTNVSFSRAGVIRGLHYHERGQDDLFACVQGTARVVVLDRETGETYTEDIGDENRMALYIPGRHGHGFDPLLLPRDCRVRPRGSGRADHPLERPARRAPVEHEHTDPVRAGRRRRVLITGAGGQLGRALQEAFADEAVVALGREDWDVSHPPSGKVSQGVVDLVLHTAAWTDVDGAEADPQGAAAVNVGGTANVAALARSLGAPLVTFSTDYVFDGRKREPYLETDAPNPLSAYGRTKLHGEAAAGTDAWIVRSAWLFGPSGSNFLRTMLELGARHDEVAVVDDQRGSPTFVAHLATAVRELVDAAVPPGVWHLSAAGDCTWAEFAEAIFAEAGLGTRVRRITTSELGRPAPRPAYSVLRSEHADAPGLPHWREGLRACLLALPV